MAMTAECFAELGGDVCPDLSFQSDRLNRNSLRERSILLQRRVSENWFGTTNIWKKRTLRLHFLFQVQLTWIRHFPPKLSNFKFQFHFSLAGLWRSSNLVCRCDDIPWLLVSNMLPVKAHVACALWGAPSPLPWLAVWNRNRKFAVDNSPEMTDSR